MGKPLVFWWFHGQKKLIRLNLLNVLEVKSGDDLLLFKNKKISEHESYWHNSKVIANMTVNFGWCVDIFPLSIFIRLIRNLRDLHLWHSGFKRNIEISYGKVKGYHSFASRLWAEQETDHWKKAAWGKWVIFLFPWVMITCGRFSPRRHEQKCLHSIYWLAIAFSINLNTINFKIFRNWWDV